MKKTNKGFSLVELIIVIAIMAILAGALAPALIKYINKSRISTDISNGQQIASAIQTALSNEGAYDSANDVTTATTYSAFVGTQGASMQNELKKILGSDVSKTEKTKSKKDVNGSAATQNFYVLMKAADNEISVYAGGTSSNDYLVYPYVGSKWSN